MEWINCSAGIFRCIRKISSGQMQPGQHVAQRMTVAGIGRFLDAPRQTTEQRGRLAGEHAPAFTGGRSQRLRTRQATRREMSHQAQIEIECGGLDTLEERQHKTPLGGADKIIGILYAGGDTSQIGQFTDG